MKTQIVYVVISSDEDYFLEELWASLFSLRLFHKTEKVLVLTDKETSYRINARQKLEELITSIVVIDVPSEYDGMQRSRYIKTNIRNLIQGDFLFIDTDTIICQNIDEKDFQNVDNIAMVPEMHGPFTSHFYYEITYKDVKRIFDENVSDAKYWFNSGCMFVRDNSLTKTFFSDWQKNWKYSAFTKGNSSDQRALLYTDSKYGYIIQRLPDVYNCQVAVSIQYLYSAKILHFWHMRARYTSDVNYSPFCNKEIYKQIRKDNGITTETSRIIIDCKNSFSSPSMIIGKTQINVLFSPFINILGRAYIESWLWHKLFGFLIRVLSKYYRYKDRKKILI